MSEKHLLELSAQPAGALKTPPPLTGSFSEILLMHPPVDSSPSDALKRAAVFLATANSVAVLTGAGVSAESGLATFRGADGLWEGHRVEDVATPMAFERDPGFVWRFYNMRRANLVNAQPNPGHHALAALEDRFGSERFTLITQNVDGLHRAAGSRHVLELHGSLKRVRCTGCGVIEDRGVAALDDLPECPTCGELLRPDVVWFHEPLPEDVWEQAAQAACTSDCFLVVGTSAVVYPAAGLIIAARQSGARVIEINLTQTEASERVDLGLYGPSGQILPELVERVKNQH
jgi:NAD-dependent deacetylase